MSDNFITGNNIISGRIRSGTRRCYSKKLCHLRKWLDDNFNNLYSHSEDDTIKLPIQSDHLKEFFGYICRKRGANGQHLDPIQYHSFSYVSGYRSAIKDYYNSKGISFSADVDLMLSDFLGGYARKIADLKQSGEMSLVEGKRPISFAGYKYLAERCFEQSSDFNVSTFALSFMQLSWNLMSRSISVGLLMYRHISWENDSMVVSIPKHKGDQEGKFCLPKHVYSNPYMPEICPVLGLAIYIFTRGSNFRGDRSPMLFGLLSEARFSKWLRNLLDSKEEDLMALGIDIAEIGTHSFRKGISSYISSFPGGPSAVAVWLRAGWSLGKVQSRYIFEGQGGDQFVGRCAAGLDVTNCNFSVLPPHFDISDGPVLSLEEWNVLLPGYSTFYPDEFRTVIPFLLASIVYHKNFLNENLSSNHPLKLSRLWTSGTIDKLSSKVIIGQDRNQISRMSATGIPPHIALSNRIVALESNLSDLDGNIQKLFENVFNRLSEVPISVCREILERIQVNGAMPITHEEINRIMSNLREDIRNDIQIAYRNDHSNLFTQTESSEGNIGPAAQFQFWTWGGRLHMIPESFAFPM